MERRTVQLTVAGQSFRVVTSATEDELRRLVSKVDAKVSEVTPRGRPVVPNAMLLAAMSLAHDLEEERALRSSLESRTRDVLRRALVRIDDALESEDSAEARA